MGAIVAVLLIGATACSSPSEPGAGSMEPDPFPDARSVRLWIDATGLVLDPFETFQLSFHMDEPEVTVRLLYQEPLIVGVVPLPAEYRRTWWSSDPGVVSVDSRGMLRASGGDARSGGEAVIWVQVENQRDSALVRVASPADPAGPRYASVVAGVNHTCALTENGEAYCWGWDGPGSLGRGVHRWFTWGASPERVVGEHVFDHLALGFSHTCGLLENGEAWCWGQNHYGQIGNGRVDPDDMFSYDEGEPTPVPTVGAIPFDTLVATVTTTCGLGVEGAAYCWGRSFGAEPTLVAENLNFRLLAGLCGVTTDDATYCWDDGEPVLVATEPSFVSLTSNRAHRCGLTDGGDTYCWGPNGNGQLGTESVESSDTPILLEGGFEFVALTAGDQHTCGLTAAGEAWCWGHNGFRQLGSGEDGGYFHPDPRPVVGGLSFTSISAASYHTCGVALDGMAYCWGNGALGNGGGPEESGSGVPTRVVAPFEP